MEFYNKKPLLRRCAIILTLLLLVFLAAVWFFRASTFSSKKPGPVILISIDTCRADYLSCYGYPRQITPNIDAIAKEGILFENALAHWKQALRIKPDWTEVRNKLDQVLRQKGPSSPTKESESASAGQETYTPLKQTPEESHLIPQ